MAPKNMAASVMKGYPLREVVVNLPGVHAASHGHTAEIQISGHEITNNDVRRALAKAQEQVLSDEYETHPYHPDGFFASTGMTVLTSRAACTVSIWAWTSIWSPAIWVRSGIWRPPSNARILISPRFVSRPTRRGLAVLVEDEMDLGATVIDIGGGVTSFAVFHGGVMIYADAIPIGGAHITNDIAKGLTTSTLNAERLKVLYGSAMASHMDESELIDVPRLGEDEHSEPNHVPALASCRHHSAAHRGKFSSWCAPSSPTVVLAPRSVGASY
jgi:cell division protein FtsA